MNLKEHVLEELVSPQYTETANDSVLDDGWICISGTSSLTKSIDSVAVSQRYGK